MSITCEVKKFVFKFVSCKHSNKIFHILDYWNLISKACCQMIILSTVLTFWSPLVVHIPFMFVPHLVELMCFCNVFAGQVSTSCSTCGAPCALRTANTTANRGRKFYSCQSQACNFFVYVIIKSWLVFLINCFLLKMPNGTLWIYYFHFLQRFLPFSRWIVSKLNKIGCYALSNFIESLFYRNCNTHRARINISGGVCVDTCLYTHVRVCC